MSRDGRISASTIVTISPRVIGIASLSAIALPSLTRFSMSRIRPADTYGRSSALVASLEPSSTTITSKAG